MPEPRLTPQQAYAAMTLFLEGHYRRTGSDDIGGLLGDMAVRADGTTADAAMWADWLASITRTVDR
jgi:hypothetical protein